MKATLEKLKEIFKREVDQRIDVESFDPDVSVMEQGVDSLDRSSVFLAMEEEFNVKFTDADVVNLESYNQIIEFINKQN